jgi:sugar phosphate isomerase/epimerase
MGKFMISAFADEIDPSLDVQMDVLDRYGISHIEMRGVDGRNITEYSIPEAKVLKARMDARGFMVSAVGSPIGKIGIRDPFEPHLALFKHTLDIADVLQTGYIRLFSFYLPAGEDPALFRDEVMRRWSAFVAAAEGRGVTLLHENEKGIYGDVAVRCLDLIDTMHCPYLKATFDPANFVQGGEETFPEAFRLLEKHVAYMHIKDALYASGNVVPAGEGEGKVEEILKALQSADWNGFLSLEPHLDHSLPGGGPVLFGVACNALNRILARIGGN